MIELAEAARRGGIVEIHSAQVSESALQQLADASVQIATWEGISDLVSFHRTVARALHFPPYYGANLDALWDCLHDLDGATVVLWRGWSRLAIEEPQAWARVISLLRERSEEQPPFTVALLG